MNTPTIHRLDRTLRADQFHRTSTPLLHTVDDSLGVPSGYHLDGYDGDIRVYKRMVGDGAFDVYRVREPWFWRPAPKQSEPPPPVSAEVLFPEVKVTYPDWVKPAVDWQRTYTTDTDKMSVAIEMSRQNVRHGTGGPFGAAIFDRKTGKIVAVGMNQVVQGRNSTLHGEMVAIQMAESRLNSFTLADAGRSLELFTSCEPCAMCLGATLWSGVTRMVSAATGEDARAVGFDEGPVFPQSWDYLVKAGVEIARNVCGDDARAVLEVYAKSGGPIYNGSSH